MWLWFFPSCWGLLTASVWQSLSLWTEISSLLSCHFGSGCRERNSFWHIHSWNELSLAAGGSLLRLPFLLPDLMRLLVRRWDRCHRACIFLTQCSERAGCVWCPWVALGLHFVGAVWETWGSGPHAFWELGFRSVPTSLYGYTFYLNTVFKNILQIKEREGKK